MLTRLVISVNLNFPSDYRNCLPSDHKCGSGLCIPIEKRCDHYYDCRDESDESDEFCKSSEYF